MQNGLYDTADEYLRDLVRLDFETDESKRFSRLQSELEAGMKAPESDFVPLEIASIVAEAKASHVLSA